MPTGSQGAPRSGISLSDESLSLVYPGTARLSYALYPADPTETVSVSWSSENTGVVTVDENGLVSAVRGGTADVILCAGGFEQRCTCTVTVPVTGLSLPAHLTLPLLLPAGDTGH